MNVLIITWKGKVLHLKADKLESPLFGMKETRGSSESLFHGKKDCRDNQVHEALSCLSPNLFKINLSLRLTQI